MVFCGNMIGTNLMVKALFCMAIMENFIGDQNFAQEFPAEEIEKYRLFNPPFDPFVIIEQASEKVLSELF